MRLRIAHQLSLLLTAAVVLAVLAVGGLSLWNLRSGFGEYLRLRDDEQLTRFVQLLERRAAADPSMNWLRGNREAQRDLMDELSGRPIQPRIGRPQEPGEDTEEPPPRRRPPPPGLGGPGGPGGPAILPNALLSAMCVAIGWPGGGSRHIWRERYAQFRSMAPTWPLSS